MRVVAVLGGWREAGWREAPRGWEVIPMVEKVERKVGDR